MLNKEFYELVTQFRKEKRTWEEVRKLLVKTGSVSTKATGDDVKKRYQELAARVAAGEIDLEVKDEFAKAVELIDEAIGRVRENRPKKLARALGKSSRKPGDRKILTIGDLHIPFVDHDKLWEAVERGLDEGCNELVINGDYLNGDSLSTHAKFKMHSLEEEVAFGAAILEQLAEKFDTVYLLDDNHISDRWRRWLGEKVPPDRHFLMIHPYAYMCDGIKNVVRAGQTHDQFPDELSHFMILGDIMFSHGFVSGKDGESVRKVKHWYSNWKSTLNLDTVRVWAHGHSHNLGINFDADAAIIQTGTFATLEGLRYALEGNLKYSPPVYGYSILEQFGGVTDLSTIKIIKQ